VKKTLYYKFELCWSWHMLGSWTRALSARLSMHDIRQDMKRLRNTRYGTYPPNLRKRDNWELNYEGLRLKDGIGKKDHGTQFNELELCRWTNYCRFKDKGTGMIWIGDSSLSMKCHVYQMSCLWISYFMKWPVYEILSMKWPNT